MDVNVEKKHFFGGWGPGGGGVVVELGGIRVDVNEELN